MWTRVTSQKTHINLVSNIKYKKQAKGIMQSTTDSGLLLNYVPYCQLNQHCKLAVFFLHSRNFLALVLVFWLENLRSLQTVTRHSRSDQTCMLPREIFGSFL